MLHKLDLNGTWHLRWYDGERGGPFEAAFLETMNEIRYIKAQVPGEIHLDLMRAGLLPDVYVEGNCRLARWVEDCFWGYRREFDVPADALIGQSWLVFECLDLVAQIYLNGELIGEHSNFFYPCRLEVTDKLREGTNQVVVWLESGLYSVADKPAQDLLTLGIHNLLHKRFWLRKPQFQFGWDWAPRLINMGIQKPVYLEYTAAPARLDQFAPQVELASDLVTGTIRARLFVEGLQPESFAGELSVELAETEQQITVPVEIEPGLHAYEATLTVDQPELWWPVGHGSQHLYTVQIKLRVDGSDIGQKSARIGFRHLHLNQDPHPESGRYYCFEINGKPIFCKGANFVPADSILGQPDRARYENLIDLALEANFNFFRVWGGGVYEHDDFYALCDEKGILVWQDFIFACSKYPLYDRTLHDSVKIEATYNIRRLVEHPSLIMWCGNNEMETATWGWGYMDMGIVYPDYGFFHLTLPQLLAEEDPTRPYQPSSPYSPDHLPPNQDDVGDQHPWAHSLKGADFRRCRQLTSRFPSEGGTLGTTALPTVLTCLPEDQHFPGSFAWQIHDNSGDSGSRWSPADDNLYPGMLLDVWLGKDGINLVLEDFVYWAGLLQGEGLREFIDNFRRRMFDTGGAVFWMYNDCWPAVRSWTIVDYYLRRTPSFAAVRRAFAPVSVVVTCEDDQVTIWGINDTPNSVEGELRYGLFNLSGGLPLDERIPVSLPANTSTCLASFPRAAWTNPEHSAAFAMLVQDKTLIARNRLFLPLFKELQWSPAQLQVDVHDEQVTFSSDTFVWGICLDLDGEQALPDNFFDVYPGIPYTIPWPFEHPITVLKTGNLV